MPTPAVNYTVPNGKVFYLCYIATSEGTITITSKKWGTPIIIYVEGTANFIHPILMEAGDIASTDVDPFATLLGHLCDA